MGSFQTELSTRLKHGTDRAWILTEPLVFDSSIVGRVRVPAGFETDLASVPRIPFLYSLWGARCHREAVIHDVLFRLDSSPVVPFGMANNVFLEAMEARSKPWYIKYPMYWGVCVGSYGCYHQRKVSDEVG